MVNIHANATDSSLTARIPNTQVMPSSGSNTTVAFSTALKGSIKINNSNQEY